MEAVTMNNLMTALAVFIALCGALVTVGKAIDTIRAWHRPQVDVAAQVSALDARLRAHEEEIERLKDGQHYMCSGVLALLEHELHNGNAEQMQAASRDINNWLIRR